MEARGLTLEEVRRVWAKEIWVWPESNMGERNGDKFSKPIWVCAWVPLKEGEEGEPEGFWVQEAVCAKALMLWLYMLEQLNRDHCETGWQ